jgi:hypothetical protein
VNVIPGRATREPGISTQGTSGFRIDPLAGSSGMTCKDNANELR